MKILILYSGRLQISRHISLVATYPSARDIFAAAVTNVLPDMLSGCIEYKDLRSEKHTYKSEIGSKRIKKILILNSGRLQISRHISFVGTEL